MSSSIRNEVRSVILRLRRYRDRMQEIAMAATSAAAAGSTGATVVRRQLKSLKTDLDNDAHECVIGRKRMVQTECEHEFLWPALREAADAMQENRGPAAADGRSQAELCTARDRIQHYLTQLEGRWPTL